MFSSVSHPGTLQNLVTKDLAIEVIQEPLLRVKVLGQQEVKNIGQDRLIVAEQCDKSDVSTTSLDARITPQHLPLCIRWLNTQRTDTRQLL